MTRNILHKQIYRPGPFGGTVNTTLCGRMQGRDYNVAESDDQVNCKFCLERLKKNPNPVSTPPTADK